MEQDVIYNEIKKQTQIVEEKHKYVYLIKLGFLQDLKIGLAQQPELFEEGSFDYFLEAMQKEAEIVETANKELDLEIQKLHELQELAHKGWVANE